MAHETSSGAKCGANAIKAFDWVEILHTKKRCFVHSHRIKYSLLLHSQSICFDYSMDYIFNYPNIFSV